MAMEPMVDSNTQQVQGLDIMVDMNSATISDLKDRATINQGLLDAIDTQVEGNNSMLRLNTMTLGMVTDKTDTIDTVTTMNSDQLVSFAPTITATSGIISDNMASLTSISPTAMANQMKVSDVFSIVEENEALVNGFGNIITNNSDLIGPLKGRADMNSD